MAKTWRDRLGAEIKRQGRSYREVSLSAGLGETYVSELFRSGKDATIGNLQKVCETLGVSFTYITAGVRLTPDVEKVLAQIASVSDEQRALLGAQFQEDGPSEPAAPPQRPEQQKPAAKKPRARSASRS